MKKNYSHNYYNEHNLPQKGHANTVPVRRADESLQNPLPEKRAAQAFVRPQRVGTDGRLQAAKEIFSQDSDGSRIPMNGQVAPEFFEHGQQSQLYLLNDRLQREKVRSRKKRRKWPWIVLGIVGMLLLSFYLLWLYIFSSARTGLRPEDFMDPQKTLSESDRAENFVVPYDKEVTHVLLIGVDSRNPGEINTNSDTMIVVTLDQKKQQIRLTSFQRDMLVKIEGREGFHKLNSAMFNGPYALMKTLNYNFKLDISKYVILDFLGAERIVDLLGGASLHVPESEDQVSYLNSVIWDTNVEMGGETWIAPIEKGGYQELSGRQAIAFARIRKLDSDFSRMERQQELVNEMFRRFKSANPIKQIQVIKEALGLISTNMSDFDLVGIATSALPKISRPIDSLSVPMDGYYRDVNIGGVFYILAALNDQIPLVHQHIYQADHSKGDPVEEYPYNEQARSWSNNQQNDGWQNGFTSGDWNGNPQNNWQGSRESDQSGESSFNDFFGGNSGDNGNSSSGGNQQSSEEGGGLTGGYTVEDFNQGFTGQGQGHTSSWP